MKRWTHKEIDEATERLLKEGCLAEDEVKAFSDPPRRTLTEYQENMYKSAEVLCKITGCKCLNSLKEDIDCIASVLRGIEEENRPDPLGHDEIKDGETERAKVFKNEGKKIMARFRRQRKCHYAVRYFLVCYCDEHNH